MFPVVKVVPVSEFAFGVDLTEGEMRRRAAVVEALGSDWDPVAVLEGERAAHDLLYSGLDAEQQKTYELLVAAGVLEDRQARP
uniref:Uncharacterized protein n=2 Tax=Streptomyces TaxID=1883 RepID=H6D591_9ACTN|nr:hypothetical protein [Streptomyces albus]